MDEAYKLLLYIIVSHQQLPTSYRKLSLEPPLVDKVVDLVLTSVDPTLSLKSEAKVVDLVLTLVDLTLPLKSEVKVFDRVLTLIDLVLTLVDLVTSLVDPTLPLKSEVHVVESTSSLPDPTLLSESVKTEVVTLTKSSSCSSLPVENELQPVEVFMRRSDCSQQDEISYVQQNPLQVVSLFPLIEIT